MFVWNSFTPRVGFTYALDEARKTIVRGSYAMFASQLPAAQAAFASPIQYPYAYYNAVDRNGDGIAQLNEVLIDQGLQGYVGFDPKNPSAAVNRVATDQKAPRTQEFLAGFDKELTPHLSVSGTFTYRLMQDLPWTPLTGVTSANYSQTATLTGTAPIIGSYSVPLYALSASAVPPGGGKTFAVRDGYHQRYMGLEVSATKRLSNHWMARFGFSTNDWREYFDDPSKAILDPTRAPVPSPAWPFAGRRWMADGRAAVHRQRQERHLHGGAVVSVRRQRPLRGDLGHQRQRESRRETGLRRSRISRATSRPAIRLVTRRYCWCRTSTTSGCRR